MRKLFRTTLGFSTAAAGLLVVLGLFAPLLPPLEIINHFRPYITVAAAMLLLASLATRSSARLFTATALLFGISVTLLLVPVLYKASKVGAAGRPLRVATLNTWIREGEVDRIATFLETTQADVVLLQEVGRTDRAALLRQLKPSYPHIHFEEARRYGPALLSKQPWTAAGAIQNRQQVLAVWVRFPHGDGSIEVASVHIANPLEPHAQAEDVERLISFVRSREHPVILGGDFNLTPFSWKLVKLAHQTHLRWVQTDAATWPAHKWVPLVLIDHVLIPQPFAVVLAAVGPSVGSDHLPVYTDVVVTTGGNK